MSLYRETFPWPVRGPIYAALAEVRPPLLQILFGALLELLAGALVALGLSTQFGGAP